LRRELRVQLAGSPRFVPVCQDPLCTPAFIQLDRRKPIQALTVVQSGIENLFYFDPGSQFYGKTKAGGFTCRAFADKAGFRANKGN